MQRWEYLHLVSGPRDDAPAGSTVYRALTAGGHRDFTVPADARQHLDVMNALGAEGWELVDSEHSPFMFKRPLTDG